MVHFFFYTHMQSNTIENKINEFLLPLCTGLGVNLWGIELALSSPKHRVIRIYIDTDQGVTVEQCADVSRHMGVILDVEDFIPGAYTLEVSSPGLDRIFFSPRQLGAYLGQPIKISLNFPQNGQKNFTGILIASEEDRFTLRLEDGTEQKFTWEETRNARLVYRV